MISNIAKRIPKHANKAKMPGVIPEGSEEKKF